MSGCPQFDGALTWTYEACSWGTSAEGYRRLQELAYINRTGASMLSMFRLMLAYPVVIFAHGLLPLERTHGARVLLDASSVVLPVALQFSLPHVAWPLLFTLALLAAHHVKLQMGHKGQSRSENSENSENSESESERFIMEYRAMVMVSTCVVILAVDFSSLFPRMHAKTEEFGYSLMDLGTGSIIFASAVTRTKSTRGRVRRMLKLWPVLAIGLSRAALVWGTDYHVPQSEYGVHWNFFFTVAVVRLVSTALDLCPTAAAAAALFTLGTYQCYLSWLGGAEFLLHAERLDLVSANREGILSSAGYLGLHWIGVWVGSLL
ncbi:unnamed protein product, partial [Effrenium voratum]